MNLVGSSVIRVCSSSSSSNNNNNNNNNSNHSNSSVRAVCSTSRSVDILCGPPHPKEFSGRKKTQQAANQFFQRSMAPFTGRSSTSEARPLQQKVGTMGGIEERGLNEASPVVGNRVGGILAGDYFNNEEVSAGERNEKRVSDEEEGLVTRMIPIPIRTTTTTTAVAPAPAPTALPSPPPSSPSLSLPAGAATAAAVANVKSEQGRHPLGCMFCPELDKTGVLTVVSEVFCAPGFTSGPRDEKRLLRSVRTGRIDVRDMSRLLRWLRGERAARELRARGLRFVGPGGDGGALRPYTTGQGMSHLMEEVIASNSAGNRFVVCFSSVFDACSGVIVGVLADTVSEPGSECESSFGSESDVPPSRCGGSSIWEDARTSSTCSIRSDEDDERESTSHSSLTGGRGHAASPRTRIAGPGRGCRGPRKGGRSRSGSGGSRSRFGGFRGDGGGGDSDGGVTALLFDEKPTHRRFIDDHSIFSGGIGTGFGSGRGGVFRMSVKGWVESYGECEGPLLAAWVFPGASTNPSK